MWFRKRRRRPPPPPCPQCGKATVLAGRFCRACGWDADLVGTADSYLDGVDLPTGYGREEDGEAGASARPWRGRVFLAVGAILALASFLYALTL